MLKKTISLAVTFGALSGFAWLAGCSSNNNNNGTSSNSNSSSASKSSSSGASQSTGNTSSNSGSNSSSASGSNTGDSGASNPALQLDNESASPGTSLTPGSALKALIPTGDKIGTWYEYGSDGSQGTTGIVGTLTPNPFAFTKLDAGQFSTAACISSPGYTGFSAGIGLNFATADVDSSAPPTENVDLSSFTGITFWAMSTASTSVRVKFPDDQTDSGDPNAACQSKDAGTTAQQGCDSAFYFAEAFTPTWTQYTVSFSLLSQDPNFGAQFAAFDQKNVRQLQFEDEGATIVDGGAPAFQFCIGPISFTQ
jgi:hypothetical protein